MTRRIWAVAAALSGLVSVAAGAFAAHGIADPAAWDWLRTGAQYEAVHALAALLAPTLGSRAAPPVFLAGTLFFSGSLYAMAVGGPRWLGAVTPFGGLLFMAGWAILAWAALRRDQSPSG